MGLELRGRDRRRRGVRPRRSSTLAHAAGLHHVIEAVDIGARGGPDVSLFPIRDLVSWLVLEPDPDERERLVRDHNASWRSVRVVGDAVGTPGERELHLYRQRGCSSLLEADKQLARRFNRQEYYELEDVVHLHVRALDDVLAECDVTPSYLKIDIQGAELEAFAAGRATLESLVMLRCEVSFLQSYRGQPLFGEMLEFLMEQGFELLFFPEIHHWRRGSRVKYPRVDRDRSIASPGQLAHGDAVFFRTPEMIAKGANGPIRLLDLAFLAYAIGQTDLATAALALADDQVTIERTRLTPGELAAQMSRVDLRSKRKRARQRLPREALAVALGRRV